VTQADPDAGLARMTIGEHLDELRTRVFRSVVAIVVAMIVAFVWNAHVFEFATGPYREAASDLGLSSKLSAIGPAETFLQVMKLCFLAAIVFTSPYVLWQMWGFVAAGLYPHERRGVRVFFPISIVLFAAGCIAAYRVLLPIAMRFLIAFSEARSVQSDFAVGPYLSLCLALVLGMGIAFELPLVMLFLQGAGLVRRETFRRGWRIAVLVAFVLGMVLTADPTPTSQLLMALPLVGLYFLGVWGGKFVGREKIALTPLRAWPLVLAVGAFVALFVFADHLVRWSGTLWR
jgi:sec-independent protein translocase protein TatC